MKNGGGGAERKMARKFSSIKKIRVGDLILGSVGRATGNKGFFLCVFFFFVVFFFCPIGNNRHDDIQKMEESTSEYQLSND